MHVVARIFLVLGLLALSIFFLATLQYGGTSWNEGLLAIVPLSVFVLLSLRWAKHPPARLVKDSPEWFRFRRRAGIGLSVFGMIYFIGVGAGTALYSSSRGDELRHDAVVSKREAREAALREWASAPKWDQGLAAPEPRGISSREYEENARSAERKADDCEKGTQIGWAYCTLAFFPFVGLILALTRKAKPAPSPVYAPGNWAPGT